MEVRIRFSHEILGLLALIIIRAILMELNCAYAFLAGFNAFECTGGQLSISLSLKNLACRLMTMIFSMKFGIVFNYGIERVKA